MHKSTTEILIAIPIVAIIASIIDIVLTGAYQIGIFAPIVFYLSGALVGWLIGWVIGLPFRKGLVFRTIGSYTLGVAASFYGIYRIIMNGIIRSYRDSILAINPSLTENEWYTLREAAIPQAIPHGIPRSLFVLFIVLCLVCLYWGIRILIRKMITPSNSNH